MSTHEYIVTGTDSNKIFTVHTLSALDLYNSFYKSFLTGKFNITDTEGNLLKACDIPTKVLEYKPDDDLKFDPSKKKNKLIELNNKADDDSDCEITYYSYCSVCDCKISSKLPNIDYCFTCKYATSYVETIFDY